MFRICRIWWVFLPLTKLPFEKLRFSAFRSVFLRLFSRCQFDLFMCNFCFRCLLLDSHTHFFDFQYWNKKFINLETVTGCHHSQIFVLFCRPDSKLGFYRNLERNVFLGLKFRIYFRCYLLVHLCKFLKFIFKLIYFDFLGIQIKIDYQLHFEIYFIIHF